MRSTDILIVGGGVIGLCISIELKKNLPDSTIILIEKESSFGMHASGRNSGVLHAGFYYTSDTLKARFCREGNLAMTEYCNEKKIPINQCGKLVVASCDEELKSLNTLYERGKKNGIPLEFVDEYQINEIEPNAYTVNRALYSPSTSTVNPQSIIQSLVKDANNLGITLLTNTKYIESKNNRIKTSNGYIYCHYLINAAGLYADKIAKDNGFCNDHSILPFKGLYLYSNTYKLNTNIYPVPNINQPFLGSHFTVTHDGHVKIGPTAAPAFWREQYDYINNYNLLDNLQTSQNLLKLLVYNPFNFRSLATTELKKLTKRNLAKSAEKLVKNFSYKDFDTWAKPGIRAQLINNKTKSLEMDFLHESDDRSFHVLNAVSPAFTCSISFSRYLTEIVLNKIN